MQLESPLDKWLRSYRTNLVLPYIKPELDICDLGCGANPVLLQSLANNTCGKLVGIDRLVSNNVGVRIELRTADIDQALLPMRDEEFDLITMLAVLEHLDNYREVISNCCRSLKAGGKLLLTTPSPRSKPLLEFLANLRIISYAGVYDHKRYFEKSEVFTLLHQNGFKDIKVWGVACGLNIVAIGTR